MRSLLIAALALFAGAASSADAVQLPAACGQVARLANSGDLRATLDSMRGEAPVQPRNDWGLNLVHVGSIKLADGTTGYVWGESGASVYAYSKNGERVGIVNDPQIPWDDVDRYRWASPLGVYRDDVGEYIVWMSGTDQVEFLSRISADNTHSIVCEFGRQAAPTRKLLKKEHEVCDFALAERLEAPHFDVETGEVAFPKQEYRIISSTGRAARVDIDNDGASELLVRTSIINRIGGGCDVASFAILDAKGATPVGGKTQQLIDSAEYSCGTVPEILTHRGKTYLQSSINRYRQPHRIDVLYSIEKDQLRALCEIQLIPVHYVLSKYDAFVRTAADLYKEPWQRAIDLPGTDALALLLDNGLSPNLAKDDYPLLSAVVMQERNDLIDLLLERGADPGGNVDGFSAPLMEAFRGGKADIALKLLNAGAPANEDPIMVYLYTRAWAAEDRAVFSIYLQKYGRITDQLVNQAMFNSPLLMAELADSDLPYEVKMTYWSDGRPTKQSSFWSAQITQDPAVKVHFERLIARNPQPVRSRAQAFYKSAQGKWRADKALDSQMTDGDFLQFATNFCIHFLSGADCGPGELRLAAAEWLRQVDLPCQFEQARAELSVEACAVVSVYAKYMTGRSVDRVMLLSSGAEAGDSQLLLRDLIGLYQKKHAKPN